MAIDIEARSLAATAGQKATKVVANPTVTGTEASLTSIEVDGTKYVVADVESVNGKTGVVVLDKSDIGLGNVDNTSDANKPVSTATQTALNGKQDTLVSGTNIKTINDQSLLGEGNITIGGTSGPDYSKIVISEDTVTITEDQETEGTYYLQADNFVSFMQEVICSSDNTTWWMDYMNAVYAGSYESTEFMPKDYRFSLIFKDNHCNSCSSTIIADKGVYPNPNSPSEIDWETDGYGYPAGQSYIEYIPNSETSGTIDFEFLNGNESVGIFIPISIDDSGDDPELLFPDGNIRIVYDGDDEVDNIDKLIVWTPSCNTHFESSQPATGTLCTPYMASVLDFINKHVNVDKLIALIEDVDSTILDVDITDPDRGFFLQLFTAAGLYGFFPSSLDFNILSVYANGNTEAYMVFGSGIGPNSSGMGQWTVLENYPSGTTLSQFLNDYKNDIESYVVESSRIVNSAGLVSGNTIDGTIILSTYKALSDYIDNDPVRITYSQLMSIFDDNE